MSAESPTNKIQPFQRHGGWVLEGDFYNIAVHCLGLAEKADPRIAALKSEIENSKDPSKPSFATLQEARFDRKLFIDSTVLFSALALESFLNYYGVVRLGEDFFTRNLERLGLVKKLSIVVATCCGEVTNDSSGIIQVAARVSARRNKLVHPKTKEYDATEGMPASPSMTDARDAIADMKRFFELFEKFDPASAGSNRIV